MASTVKVDLALYQDIYDTFVAIASNFSKSTAGNGTMEFSLQPVTSDAVLRGQATGGNALGLSPEPQLCKCMQLHSF